jgi:hypothetical protein
MSHASPTSAPPSNFGFVFNLALDVYRKRTRQDLASHPLSSILQACDSPDAVLTVFREQIPEFSQASNTDSRLTKWLIPTVNVLCVFSAMLGEGGGLVCTKMPLC